MSFISSFNNQFELVKTSYIELQKETESRWRLKRLRSEPTSRVRENQNEEMKHIWNESQHSFKFILESFNGYF